MCTQSLIFSDPGTNASAPDASGKAVTRCNDKVPSGRLISVNGTLEASGQPGHFSQKIYGPAVAYNVIYLTDVCVSAARNSQLLHTASSPRPLPHPPASLLQDYSIEFDCGESLGYTNYCFHVLSRKPTMPADDLAALVKLATTYNLNQKSLPFTHTNQTACAYPPP